MKQTLFLLMMVAVMVTIAHAQSGCGDSPESPTAVLVLFGSFGAGLAVFRSRRHIKK